jgi:hypothetical protein
MILKEKEKDVFMTLDIGKKISDKYILETNKRSEVKITTLRNALTFLPDALYLNLKSKIKLKYIVNKKYYENVLDINENPIDDTLIHPKTLVYLFQYKSNLKRKNAILLGQDITNKNVTGYDAKSSHIFEYLDDNKNKIILKEVFMIPVLWYIAKILYPSASFIYINKKLKTN